MWIRVISLRRQTMKKYLHPLSVFSLSHIHTHASEHASLNKHPDWSGIPLRSIHYAWSFGVNGATKQYLRTGLEAWACNLLALLSGPFNATFVRLTHTHTNREIRANRACLVSLYIITPQLLNATKKKKRQLKVRWMYTVCENTWRHTSSLFRAVFNRAALLEKQVLWGPRQLFQLPSCLRPSQVENPVIKA